MGCLTQLLRWIDRKQMMCLTDRYWQSAMKMSHGKELNSDVSVRRKNAPLTTALDTMSFRIANMATRYSDRDVAIQLYAIACKMTALSNHLKADAPVKKT